MPPADLSEWQAVVDGLDKVQGEVDIAMVGKYVDLTDPCSRSTRPCACRHQSRRATSISITSIPNNWAEGAAKVRGHGRDSGSPAASVSGCRGQIAAARFARKTTFPTRICLRDAGGVIDSRATWRTWRRSQHRVQSASPYPVIALITERLNADGSVEQRGAGSTSAARCVWVPALQTSRRVPFLAS